MFAENFRCALGIAREYRIENFPVHARRLRELDRAARDMLLVEQQPVTPRFLVETLLHAGEPRGARTGDNREVEFPV